MTRHLTSVLIFLSAIGCERQSRRSISANTPVAVTLGAHGDEFNLRVNLSIPDGYVRQRGTRDDEVEWRDSSDSKSEFKAPLVVLSFNIAVPYEGKNQCSASPRDTALVYEAHQDTIARQCGRTVSRYLRIHVPPRFSSVDWWLSCSAQFLDSLPSTQDVNGVDAICGSIRSEVQEATPPQPPAASDTTKEGRTP